MKREREGREKDGKREVGDRKLCRSQHLVLAEKLRWNR